jgi:23S rRNA (cytidine2498-2'-O)-methyltransferase
MTTSSPDDSSAPLQSRLVRLPKLFDGIAEELVACFGAVSSTRLGRDYDLIRTVTPERVAESEASLYVRWQIPMDHTWPCQPRKMEGFIEKAAQTLQRKFADRKPQGIFIGTLHPTSPDRYFKTLASNLRGRVLQLFPNLPVGAVEDQDPLIETLFCLVGKEGLYCGMATPRSANGFYPGGSKYIDQDAPDTISRAGAKIAEALHYLRLHRPALPEGAQWLELGACPGGMTSELLARGQRVTAIDRSPLDPRLNGRPGLKFVLADVSDFPVGTRGHYDALLCDMNGPPEDSIAQVIRLSPSLKKGGLVVFTLKVPRIETVDGPLAWYSLILRTAEKAGLRLLAKTHLTYNRHEFTLFFET